ncbi:choline BCCT transporter BetT [Xanthomonas nasturtii]|uniref:BCCT family transporter n=1 Tax=Xanthomonas TaxID=338 RepID=UPI002B2340BC|nr:MULTISPECIES: choline BCCT transporter BetT [Xanthomonas]MEA9556403.1 choline BCCT transporter BetT [Xanthomonas nasturtii]MEA9588035.1 choline BCCT transporter BetT [Xanthomonas sp. WHRI 10064B]MEA9615757.1 choline BCCT transporter BetT [Xanthomonas sp. WHRI 10064A]
MQSSAPPSTPVRQRILPQVFIPTAAIVLLLLALSIFVPEKATTWFTAAKNWTANDAGWFTILSVAGFLVFVVGVAISGYGRIKLGPDHSRPDYSYASWFAMLFAAGMGIGLMFFGVAEPIMHYATPPTGTPESAEAARQAMRITFFHWGVHAWAIYAVVALALAYFAYRHNLPLRVRSALYPLIGERIHGPIGHAVDTFAALGTIFGLATSLGLGVMQINSGLNYLFGLEVSTLVQVSLIGIIILVATGSVVAGLDSGVRRLSEINMIMAVALLAFVLVCGPTVHLMQAFVQNTGMYASQLFSMTFNLYAYEPSGWLGGWTLFYWGWWIAWSPFVGMFIARISRGRTVREFVVGVLLVPIGFTFLWMTIYGNSALFMVRSEGVQELVKAVSDDSSMALFEFLRHLPLTMFTSSLAVVLVALFFVTSADSGALVIDMLTSKGEEESPVWQRIFWALLVGGIAVALLIAGGLESLQAATIASALPFTIVMILMCWGLLKAMHLDATKRSISRDARLLPGTSEDWRARLKLLAHNPVKMEVVAFIKDQVLPALQEVAVELRKQDLPVEVTEGEDGRAWLRVGHGEEMDFFYSVRPQPYEPPTFALQDPRRPVSEGTRHYRAEVYLREGGQDYDVMGWPKVQLIHDVLDQYERHRQFLDHVR